MEKRIYNNSEFTKCDVSTACPFADALNTAWRALVPQTVKSRRDMHALIYVRGYRRRLLKDC